MPRQIIYEITPEILDAKQIEAIAKEQTEERCEWGQRFTPEQVRAALFRALQKLIDEYRDDLAMLTYNREWVDLLPNPEKWDDPRLQPCAMCSHPRGEHDEEEHYCYAKIIRDGQVDLLECECKAFIPQQSINSTTQPNNK